MVIILTFIIKNMFNLIFAIIVIFLNFSLWRNILVFWQIVFQFEYNFFLFHCLKHLGWLYKINVILMEFLSILLKFYFNEMFLLIKNFVSFVKGNLIFIYFLINNYFYLSFIHILIIINQNLAQNSFQTGH